MLTFFVLTVAFDFYYPTVVLVILAVANDGSMLALAKDRVMPSKRPDSWRLAWLFLYAIMIGVWLSASTIVLFVLVHYVTNFHSWFNLRSLSDGACILRCIPFHSTARVCVLFFFFDALLSRGAARFDMDPSQRDRSGSDFLDPYAQVGLGFTARHSLDSRLCPLSDPQHYTWSVRNASDSFAQVFPRACGNSSRAVGSTNRTRLVVGMA